MTRIGTERIVRENEKFNDKKKDRFRPKEMWIEPSSDSAGRNGFHIGYRSRKGWCR